MKKSKDLKSFKKEDAKSNDSVDKNLTAEISQEEVQIPFMYVGDIIDIIMGQMTSFLTRTITQCRIVDFPFLFFFNLAIF